MGVPKPESPKSEAGPNWSELVRTGEERIRRTDAGPLDCRKISGRKMGKRRFLFSPKSDGGREIGNATDSPGLPDVLPGGGGAEAGVDLGTPRGPSLRLTGFWSELEDTLIAGDMGVSPSQGTWIITSFAVANAIAVPLTVRN